MASDQRQLDKSPQILLIHFHSTRNVGDAAQLSAAIEILQKEFGEPSLILAANYPGESDLRILPVEVVPSVTSLIGLDDRPAALVKVCNLIAAFFRILFACAFSKRSHPARDPATGWSRLMEAYRKANLVLSVPGNIFFTMGRFGFPFLCSSLAILPALCHRKPFYVMPQSIGPLKRPWERWILKQLYQRARLVFLRDPSSVRLADEIGLPMERVKQALDPSIKSRGSIEDDVPPQLRQMGYQGSRKSIGVTVIPRMVRSLPRSHIETYYEALAHSLSSMVDKYETNIYFFPQVTGPMPHEDDRRAFREITSRMTCSQERIKLIHQPMTHEALKALYRRMDVFVASRLHSGIFAICEGVPTLMIGYLVKSRGFMESIKAEEWLLDLGAIDPNVMSEKIEYLLLNKEQIRLRLLEEIEYAINHSPRIGQEIARNYAHGRE
jgi:colanic acid/amylovoran biosynthesis protein